jgi:hypothetical protein
MTAVPLPLQAVAETDAQPADDDQRIWSVTTILKSYGDSEGLIAWTGTETGGAAIRTDKVWHAMLDDGMDPDEVASWIARQRFDTRGERSATKLGSAGHAAIEHQIVTGRRPDYGTPLGGDLGVYDEELDPYMDSFDRFLDHAQPEFTAAEMTVYNLTYSYAGTLDGSAVIGGQRWILDWKFSKKSFDGKGKRKQPWRDVAPQVTAYRHAEWCAPFKARKFEQWGGRRYYLLNGDERDQLLPMPEVDGGLCVHLTPHHADGYPLDCGDQTFEDFCYLIETHRITQERAPRWVGEPLFLLDTDTRKVA